MADTNPREAWITGIGIASSLGEGAQAHLERLDAAGFAPSLDETTFAPFAVHPMAPLTLETQIPKKDQRQMEPWQRYGTYAAGLALQDAGVKGNAELLARTHMIVAAGGGERDYAVDGQILSGMKNAAKPDVFLNERLLSDLRPTLFLAQLSNLLAGNISIVHGVVGSSRTFMGEEEAGVDSLRIALSRIGANQGDLFLVGGAYNAERADIVLLYEMGKLLAKGAVAPVAARKGAGMVLGSVGAFLVIEAAEHAMARGAKPIAKLSAVLSDRSNRTPGAALATAKAEWQTMAGQVKPGEAAVLSGATGIAQPTAEEAGLLADIGLPVRVTSTALGHSLEATFPANVALAAACVARGKLFAPLEAGEADGPAKLSQVVVTSFGHWRGESMALIEAI